MKLLIFDPSWGASGDMILSCLIDLGFSKSKLESIAQMLDLEFDIQHVSRSGIRALKLEFRKVSGMGRSYPELRSLIQKLDLDPEVIRDCLEIYNIIAQAESKLHSQDMDKLILYELGSNEAIFEICGCCLGIRELNPSNIWSLPVSVGGGWVRTSHGLVPVPAPITLDLLEKFRIPWRGGNVQAELLTPTGAVLLGYFVDRWCEYYPQLRVSRVGYGAGSMDLGDHPNLLRGILAEPASIWMQDEVEILETNLDHLDGRILGWIPQRLLDEGALDVVLIPAIMKKGRPGYILQVMASPQDSDRLAQILLRETGSLGVRFTGIRSRYIAQRKILESQMMGFKLRFKLSTDLQGNVLDISPEYEDLKQICIQTGIPLRELMERSKQEARKLWRSAGID